MKVADILKKKRRKLVTVKPDAHISEAMHHMRREHVGCVLISEDGKRLDGILAVRDIIYAMAEHEAELRKMVGGEILDHPVSELMTRSVRTCESNNTLREAVERMNRFKVLHLPVVDDGKLTGIVSIDDVVGNAVEAMDTEIRVLRDTLIARRT